MKMSKGMTLFTRVSKLMLIIGVALACGTAIGQEEQKTKKDKKVTDEFTLEEITVTAQFQESNLQQTPIAITAITGETLEQRNIGNISDLGLVIPNAAIRPQNNMWGPNAYIGMRGVDQNDFMPTFEPGVVVYVDDIFNETAVGSTMELVDLERIEVLRGPQGTLFGKNAIGGAIRLISKTPRGDNTGHVQVTYGDYHRLDFSGGYDFSLIEDKLFARFSAASKQIDGYVDRLDFVCQMNANGTPELAGTLPTTMESYKMSQGNCKIGEKGGSQSDAAKLVLRYLATDKLEFNVGVDYTKIIADPQAETLLRGRDPATASYTDDAYVNQMYLDRYGISIFGNQYVTGSPFKVYETFTDPLMGYSWPEKSKQDFTNLFARADYEVTDDIHFKFIYGHREYTQLFSTMQDTPFSFNAYLVDMAHDQDSFEARLNGTLFSERLDWTVGGYYYKTHTDYTGYVTLGTFGIAGEDQGTFVFGFDNNDVFDNDSKSIFIHGIFSITDQLSLTAGGRWTDESKSYLFDHTTLLTNVPLLKYGGKHYDWKLSVDYQFTEDIMAYYTMATGYRSEGTQPRPYTPGQLLPTPDEEMLMYELGAKTQFFNNRLRVNAAAFYNDYDPRVVGQWGQQCNDFYDLDAGPLYPFLSTCPAGTPMEGTGGFFWYQYKSGSGKSKGVELDITARPIPNLDVNTSVGWYNYKTGLAPGEAGYVDPDWKLQADWSFNYGVQYRVNFRNGSMLIPRLDIFYQGVRNNNDSSQKPNGPDHEVPDYTLYNARLTYMSPDSHWSLSLNVENLLDKLYWYNIDSNRNQDLSDYTYSRTGQPGRPRTLSLTLRYNIF